MLNPATPLQGYFEALRISDMVSVYHPSYRSVAELFPSYDVCRGQYSRNFHKLKRRMSMPQELEPQVDKRKMVLNHSDLGEVGYASGTGKKLVRPRMRRGREADERFNMLVPDGIKSEMAAGYVPVESNGVFYYDAAEGDYYTSADGVHLEQVSDHPV